MKAVALAGKAALLPRPHREHEEKAEARDDHAGHSHQQQRADLKSAREVSTLHAGDCSPRAHCQSGYTCDSTYPQQNAFHWRSP